MSNPKTAKKPGTSLISAGALARIHICPHFWHNQCFADSNQATKPDAGAQMRLDQGIDFEKQVVASLNVVTPQYDKNAPWTGIEPTTKLMQQKSALIYQGVLQNSRMFGIPDLLEVSTTGSKLGNHSYRPMDIKSHAQVTKRDKLQLAAYAIMLEGTQGVIPGVGTIILKDKRREEVSIEQEIQEIQTAVKIAIEVETNKQATHPLRCSECGYCPWNNYCGSERRLARSVTLLHGIRTNETKVLIDVGLGNYDKLSTTPATEIETLTGLTPARSVELQTVARAWSGNTPILVNKPLLPPPGSTVIHYDIETFGDRLYLHGLIVLKDGKKHIKQFIADSPDKEESALCEFLNYLRQWEKPIIYTWTTFENDWLKEMASRYPDQSKSISELLKFFQDLKEIVKNSLAMPVTTFSIKEVAPVFGFSWRATDAGGSNSEAWYAEWLKNGDRNIHQKILFYNEDDVQAMDVIFTAISKL